MAELGLLGGALLEDSAGWLHAIMPLVTHMECSDRGLDSVVEREAFLLAARYATKLRELVKLELELDWSDHYTDFELVELCRVELETVENM